MCTLQLSMHNMDLWHFRASLTRSPLTPIARRGPQLKMGNTRAGGRAAKMLKRKLTQGKTNALKRF